MDYELIEDLELMERSDGGLGLVVRLPGRAEYFRVPEEALEALQGQIQTALGGPREVRL